MTDNHSRLLLLVVVFLSSLLQTTICAAAQFHSTSYGYHLDLPHGWIEIPEDMLQESRATLQKQASATSIIYDAGFQLDSADQWFEYPYVLVQPLPYGGLRGSQWVIFLIPR